VLPGQAFEAGGLGDGELDRGDVGRAGLSGPGGDGCVAERDAQVRAAAVVLAAGAVVTARAGGGGGEGDVAAQVVADGGLPQLGQGGQGGVPADRIPGAGLALVPAQDVLRVGDRLRGFDRLPAEVELTNPRHPLAGQRVPVVSAYRRGGGVWLVVVLPDGFPAGVPVDDTDLGGAPVAAGVTVLSVAGIRRLRELAVAMAAGGRGR
jgi:hypothetical protein